LAQRVRLLFVLHSLVSNPEPIRDLSGVLLLSSFSNVGDYDLPRLTIT
jgi:hypothetical protein